MRVASFVCGCLAMAALVTLSGNRASATSSSPAARRPVVMMPLPARLLTRCRSAFVLRPACPRLIPKVSGLVVSGPTVQYPKASGFTVFDLELGAPHEKRTWLNRPPGVLHLTLVAGRRPGNLFGGMPYPGSKGSATLRNGQSTQTRREPLLYGTRRWGGHRGSLFLAPSYPLGGQIGGHLTFWWREGRDGYVVSLHAWEPLAECSRVLHAIIASTRKGLAQPDATLAWASVPEARRLRSPRQTAASQRRKRRPAHRVQREALAVGESG